MAPADIRPASSQATIERILVAARVQFAQRGYERTTIRGVAAQAEIDPSMVMRYFTNKDGLFEAATAVDLDLPSLNAVNRQHMGQAIVTHFLHLWDDLQNTDPLLLLLRSSLTNRAAAQRISDVFSSQVLPFVHAVDEDRAHDAARRAGLIATQMLGLALCRYGLRLHPIATMSAGELIDDIGPVIDHFLADTASDRSPTKNRVTR